jgi:hypothetical protein
MISEVTGDLKKMNHHRKNANHHHLNYFLNTEPPPELPEEYEPLLLPLLPLL